MIANLEPISSDLFRLAMRNLGSSVCVITSQSKNKFSGMTATAVMSLSDNPPSLLVSVNRKNNTYGLIKKSGGFAVNLLSAEQIEVSQCFSKSGEAELQFSQAGDWEFDNEHPPILKNSVASFSCLVGQRLRTQSHDVLEGLITHIHCEPNRKSLLYASRKYHVLPVA